MDIHKSARLTLMRRERLAHAVLVQKMSLQAAARFVSAPGPRPSGSALSKEGLTGMADRCSRPHRSPRRTGEVLEERVENCGSCASPGTTMAQTAALGRATVSRILRRSRLSRRRDLEPAVPLIRYEHAAPGDLLHLDIKHWDASPGSRSVLMDVAAARVTAVSWTFMSLLTTTREWPSPRCCPALKPLAPLPSCAPRSLFSPPSASPFVACSPTTARYRLRAFRAAEMDIGRGIHPPYTPGTNGKAERFIQTALSEWAYARSDQNSQESLATFFHGITTTTAKDLMVASTMSTYQPLRLIRNNLLKLHS